MLLLIKLPTEQQLDNTPKDRSCLKASENYLNSKDILEKRDLKKGKPNGSHFFLLIKETHSHRQGTRDGF